MRVNYQPSVTGKNQAFGMAFLPPKYMTMANGAEHGAMDLAKTKSAIAEMAKDFDVQISRYIKISVMKLDNGVTFPDTDEGERKANNLIQTFLQGKHPVRLFKSHHYMIEVSKRPQTSLEKLGAFLGSMPKGCALSEALPEPPHKVVASDLLVDKLEDTARDALHTFVNGPGLKSKERESLRTLAEKHLADPNWQYMHSLRRRRIHGS